MWFLSLIPFVGKIVDAWKAYNDKKLDSEVEKYRVKGNIDIEAMKQDTAIIQARVDLAKARSGDPADRVGRILIMWPWGIYLGWWGYYLTLGPMLPKWIVWKPFVLPEELAYIPYAVVAYLFAGIIKKSIFK